MNSLSLSRTRMRALFRAYSSRGESGRGADAAAIAAAAAPADAAAIAAAAALAAVLVASSARSVVGALT